MHSKTSAWVVAAVLSFSGVALAQAHQEKRTLVVNGHTGDATIVQINGRPYIDLATLAGIANGSVSFQGMRIVLTIPSASADDTMIVSADTQAVDSTLSADFMRSAIQELGVIKEWYSSLAYAIQHGIPGDGSRMFVYRDKAAQGFRWATVAASTIADRNALQLLKTYFNDVQKWQDTLAASRK